MPGAADWRRGVVGGGVQDSKACRSEWWPNVTFRSINHHHMRQLKLHDGAKWASRLARLRRLHTRTAGELFSQHGALPAVWMVVAWVRARWLTCVLTNVLPPRQAQSDRFNVNISFSKNWEHLQNKYVGTGHPDMAK